MKKVYRYKVYTKEILNMKVTLYIDFIVDSGYAEGFRAYGIRTLVPFKKRTSIN
jgi:hypothetical protein